MQLTRLSRIARNSLPVIVAGLVAFAHGDATAAPPRPRPARVDKKRPAPPTPEPVTAPTTEAPSEPVLQRSNRMELDARVVRGETARSGAVYLFQRAPRRLPPLVGLEQSYLDEIVVPVLGPDALVAPIAFNAAVEPAPPPSAPTPPVPATKPAGGGR